MTALVRATLWATAPLNLLAAVALAFPAAPLGRLVDLPAQEYSLYTLLSGSLVGLFGITYAWLAVRTHIDPPILFVGACGKISAVLISLFLFGTGRLSGVTTTIVCGDLLFAAIWLTWLYRGQSRGGT